MPALHGREPRALAGHVVEDEVRERAQQHRVVGAQRLLDRLGVLPALEDGENVGAARPAPERLRVVGVDEAEHEVRVACVAVRVCEARAFELGAEQLGETAERRRRRVAEERVLHSSRVVRHSPYDKCPSTTPSVGTVNVSAKFSQPTTTSGRRER